VGGGRGGGGLCLQRKKQACNVKSQATAKLATMPSCDCPLVLVGAAHTIEQNVAHEAKHLFRLQRRTHGLQLLTNSPSSPIQRHLYAAAAAVLRAVGSHRRDEWSKSYAAASVLSPCLNTVVDGLYRGSSSDRLRFAESSSCRSCLTGQLA
jgi:hypothetical protein